ncbi:MAG: hypothetical protein CSA62_01000 [Planctomycetota bacterium]|nr:MAG: hypothetical protein CSA62_01000 [Planctomycetota bacterium]
MIVRLLVMMILGVLLACLGLLFFRTEGVNSDGQHLLLKERVGSPGLEGEIVGEAHVARQSVVRELVRGGNGRNSKLESFALLGRCEK